MPVAPKSSTTSDVENSYVTSGIVVPSAGSTSLLLPTNICPVVLSRT